MITTEEETRPRRCRWAPCGALAKPIKTREALDEVFGEIRATHGAARALACCSSARTPTRAPDPRGSSGDAGRRRRRGVTTGAEALGALRRADAFDCMVLDRGRRTMPRLRSCVEERRAAVRRRAHRRSSSHAGSGRPRRGREGTPRSATQAASSRTCARWSGCIDEVAFSCTARSRAARGAPAADRATAPRRDAVLAGKKVLIVDDDIRNIFAHDQHPRAAATWRSSRPRRAARRSSMLETHAGRRHRPDGHHDARHGRLRHDAGDPQERRGSTTCPIIARDRQGDEGGPREVLEAGASDYLAKPVDTEQLLAVLRAWLYR